jgi:hypothetical protein
LRGLVFSNQVLLLYCCFTAALLLLHCGRELLFERAGVFQSGTTALLLLYCCFTAALLLLSVFFLRGLVFPIRLCTEKWRLRYRLRRMGQG